MTYSRSKSLFCKHNFDCETDENLFLNLSRLRLLDMSSNSLRGFLPAHFYRITLWATRVRFVPVILRLGRFC
jgi:hypothetical protein